MPFSNSILAGDRLVRTAIESDQYVEDLSGWRIERDGDAYFNNLAVNSNLRASGVSPITRFERADGSSNNTSNVTFTGITGMSGVTLQGATAWQPSSVYQVRYLIRYDTAITTTGIAFRVSYSGAVVNSEFHGTFYTDDVTVMNRNHLANNVIGPSPTAGSVNGEDLTVILDGFINVSTVGLLKLEFRSEVSGSQVNVFTGTFGVITEVQYPPLNF
jgi:hypothetical protein